MRVLTILVLITGSTSQLLAEEFRFVTPLALDLVRSPSGVAAGDLNGDGKLDLMATSGTGGIEILRQDPADRVRWERSLVTVGTSPFMARAHDLNGDGFGEIVVADLVAGVWLLRNQGGELLPAQNVAGARSTRWITFGDWNGDDHTDLATANFEASTVSIYLGNATGDLVHSKNYPIAEPHAIEGFDYDGDADLDLALGHGDHGVRVLENKGDGTFILHNIAAALAPCARYVYTGEFNQDGKDDLVLTCLRDSPQGIIANTLVGISQGNGEFRASLDLIGTDIATAAVADLNRDGYHDVIQVALNRQDVAVHAGKGDGTFFAPRLFGPTDPHPIFVIADDIDADGFDDVITADSQSTLTILWGRPGDVVLESARMLQRSAGATSAIADFDRNGVPDFIFPVSAGPNVEIFLNPGTSTAEQPDHTFATPADYNYLAVVDLSGDGTADLLGANTKLRQVQRSILDPGWAGELHAATPLESVPSGFVAGLIDGNQTVDAAVLSITSSSFTVLLGDGNGGLAPQPAIATLERPRLLLLGDADLDGIQDLILSAPGIVGVHYGTGGGAFAPAVEILRIDPPRSFIDIALGDVTADGHPDIVVTAPGGFLKLLAGKGQREFAAPLDLKLPGNGRSLALADMNGDGQLDITSANTGQTFSVLLNRGASGPDPPLLVAGAWPDGLDHRVVDATQDGILDVIVFAAGVTFLFEALPHATPPPSRFRRGDADWTGKADLTDAVAILRHLFQGGGILCEDPGDADDDGRLAITDAVVLLSWLFQGAAPPLAPGPESCGEDPTADALASCTRDCE